MEKTEENTIIGKQKIIAQNHRIFFAENSGKLNNMVAFVILFMPGICVLSAHSFRRVGSCSLLYLALLNALKIPHRQMIQVQSIPRL